MSEEFISYKGRKIKVEYGRLKLDDLRISDITEIEGIDKLKKLEQFLQNHGIELE